MNIPADRPAGSPLARAYGASEDLLADSVRRYRNFLATAEASAQLVRKSGKPMSDQVVLRNADGRPVLVNRSEIKRRHAITVAERHAVRKAQNAGLLPVFDANGNIRGVMDPKDLEDEGSVDEAVFTEDGKQVGFVDAKDVRPVQAAPKASGSPRPPATDVQKAYRILANASTSKALRVSDLRWAAEVLRRAGG